MAEFEICGSFEDKVLLPCQPLLLLQEVSKAVEKSLFEKEVSKVIGKLLSGQKRNIMVQYGKENSNRNS